MFKKILKKSKGELDELWKNGLHYRFKDKTLLPPGPDPQLPRLRERRTRPGTTSASNFSAIRSSG